MPVQRSDRISAEYRKILSEKLRELKDPRIAGMVSVTRCDVTADLRYAKVYVSVLGTDEDAANTIKGLRSAAGFLRGEVSRAMGLRASPEPMFISDDSIRRGAQVIASLKKLETNDGDSAEVEE